MNAAVFCNAASFVATDKKVVRVYSLRNEKWLDGAEFTPDHVPEKLLAAASVPLPQPRLALASRIQNSFQVRVYETGAAGQSEPILERQRPLQPDETVDGLIFNKDATTVYVVTKASRVQVFRLNANDLASVATVTAGRNLGKDEWPYFEILGLGGSGENTPDLALQYIPKYRRTLGDTWPTPEKKPSPKLPFFERIVGKKMPTVDAPVIKGNLDGSRLTSDGKSLALHSFDLDADRTYVFEMRSPKLDSYLILNDPAGIEVARDDDSGGGLDARIIFNCKTKGQYILMATTYARGTGEYILYQKTVGRTKPSETIKLIQGEYRSEQKITDEMEDTGSGPACATCLTTFHQGK